MDWGRLKTFPPFLLLDSHLPLISVPVDKHGGNGVGTGLLVLCLWALTSLGGGF